MTKSMKGLCLDGSISTLGLTPQALIVTRVDLNAVSTEIAANGETAVAALPASGSEQETAAAVLPGELMRRLGRDKTVPAVTRMRQRWTITGWKSFGLAVDVCNMASMEHNMSVGLHDLTDHAWTDIWVGRAIGGLSVLPSFRKSTKAIPPGDLVYGLRNDNGDLDVMAWLGALDVDAAKFQIDENSEAALVMVLGNAGQPAEATAACVERIIDLFAVCGATIETVEAHEYV